MDVLPDQPGRRRVYRAILDCHCHSDPVSARYPLLESVKDSGSDSLPLLRSPGVRHPRVFSMVVDSGAIPGEYPTAALLYGLVQGSDAISDTRDLKMAQQY